MSDSGNGHSIADRLPEPASERPAADGTLEARLSENEARLARDEALIAAETARLARDESRLVADEEASRLTRRLSIISVGLGLVLIIAVAGLVIGAAALRHDVDAISAAAPDGSVGTTAIQEGAVTADKLADGSVTGVAIAPGAIGRGKVAPRTIGASELAAGAVTAAAVRSDSLTGTTIREGTLDTVPAARVSGHARTASDASRLGGSSASAYLHGLRTVEATSPTDVRAKKGPVAARCPAGTRVIAGGATVRGPVRGVAIARSAPRGTAAWVAATDGRRDATAPLHLVVKAICAAEGR
jgi:hypothetical protein